MLHALVIVHEMLFIVHFINEYQFHKVQYNQLLSTDSNATEFFCVPL